jgi:hypothetical protein
MCQVAALRCVQELVSRGFIDVLFFWTTRGSSYILGYHRFREACCGGILDENTRCIRFFIVMGPFYVPTCSCSDSHLVA